MSLESPEPVTVAPRTNRILAALPADERKRLQPYLETVTLTQRLPLYEMNSPIEHVYFIHRGVASLVTPMPDAPPVEVATVGPEGMVGMPVFLQAEQIAHRAFIQVPGSGVRIEADDFQRVIKCCPALNHILMRYTVALMHQMSQNSACNRSHSVEERCARWLLMTHDRVHETSFPLTQEFLADMLGVRRPTVSIAAGMLAKAGLVHYVRGKMTILDRRGLEAASCECYANVRSEYERLVGGDG